MGSLDLDYTSIYLPSVTWGMQPIEVIELEQTDLKVN
jgi:hypothetical protein